MIGVAPEFPEFSKGDSVRIKSGPFEDFVGIVDQFIVEHDLVRVMVKIFDRPTPLELKSSELEKRKTE